MILPTYRNQTALLIRIIPVIEKERILAMHGGTAINLFLKELPRLSVDIDLTYTLFDDRQTTLTNIHNALSRIATGIQQTIPGVSIDYKKDTAKIFITFKNAAVKLEVNLVTRGLLSPAVQIDLCQKAQKEFDAFCSALIVPEGQLYGGKICAALDRQHPRDIFDVKEMLLNESYSEEIKRGFLLRLLGGTRPPAEVLDPNFQDQRQALENQFSGMTNLPFSYEEYTSLRHSLKDTVQHHLTTNDIRFIQGFEEAKPDWGIYDFSAFPAIQWRLKNIAILQKKNPEKYQSHQQHLEAVIQKIQKTGKIQNSAPNKLLEQRERGPKRGLGL